MGGAQAEGFRYGRLEIFMRGFWSNVCAADFFTPAAAQVACSALGFQGGAALQFYQPYSSDDPNLVCPPPRPWQGPVDA